MRELPRDLVTILLTEAKNQRTPPIDYVVAEDGGRMVHRPDPDIAMAELLEEAAAALASERAAHAETRRALDGVIEACNHAEAQALGLAVDLKTTEAALAEAMKALGMMLKEHDILSGNFGDVMDPKHKRPDRWPTAAEAARRALEAQGGE